MTVGMLISLSMGGSWCRLPTRAMSATSWSSTAERITFYPGVPARTSPCSIIPTWRATTVAQHPRLPEWHCAAAR